MRTQHDIFAVKVRYFAGARSASGIAAEAFDVPAGTTIAALLDQLTRRHGMRLAAVLPACSFLLDGRAVRDVDRVVPHQAELDILPPFAGG